MFTGVPGRGACAVSTGDEDGDLGGHGAKLSRRESNQSALWNTIGDGGARLIAASPRLGRLQHLDLSHNPMSVEALVDRPGAGHLRDALLSVRDGVEPWNPGAIGGGEERALEVVEGAGDP